MTIKKGKYLFSSHSSLKSQLHSFAGSSICLSYEFHFGAAIPPKKQFGSSELCIITRVGPKNVIISSIKIPLLSQSEWNAAQLNLNIIYRIIN